MNERITAPGPMEDDLEFERSLRPSTFEDFPGQEQVKEKLKIYIEAANQRGEPLDHILLHGPPGLGKTTRASTVRVSCPMVGAMNAMVPSRRGTSGPPKMVTFCPAFTWGRSR